MASISSTGSVSSAGIGSGLDVAGIVSKMMDVEKAPLTLLQAQASDISTKISAFGALKSAMSAFRDAANALTLPSAWSATTATSADASIASGTTTSGGTAGNYAVTVSSLATAQAVATGAFANSTALVGAGTMHIDLGTWAAAPANSFTAKSGSTGLDITVGATDTLSDVRDKINAAGAGVNASIVTDLSGSRMVLTSTNTGTDNGFRVTAQDADGNNADATGLSALAYDPQNSTTGTSRTQSAGNANATINGLPVSSATNKLTGVIQGLDITLGKVSATPVQITVGQDNTAIKGSISNFVTAYNALSTLLTTDTKYDKTTTTAGPLQGDSTAVSMQRQLRNIISASTSASSVFGSLSQVGLEVQKDGTLKINDTKLTASLGNLAEVKKLFSSNAGNDPSNYGIAQKMGTLGNSMLNTGGLLVTRNTGLNTTLAANGKRQTDMQSRLDATESRLKAQYTALDTKMASLTTLSTYLTQQIAGWNKNT